MKNLLCRPAIFLFILTASLLRGEDEKPARAPNVLVIIADDVGWGDLGCYGGKIPTPHLDSLAKKGLRFTDSHATAAVCTPTRYSLLTGEYAWRVNAIGLNKGVSNGNSPLLISPAKLTLPKMMQQAGYRSAAIGKWHLGFGLEVPDYNSDLKPGPLECGFHEFFGFPATNDRMPTVYVRNHRVVGLDPADPIRVSYHDESAKRDGLSRIAAGRHRIGWMSGGKAAWWKDETIGRTFTTEVVQFIERNRQAPFFLYFAPHAVHAPPIPDRDFAGRSGLGGRADMLMDLDAQVGKILTTLEAGGLSENTLIVFTSDNGAYVQNEKGHRPNGPYRGEKSQLWEGGHRVPMIVSWPAKVKPAVSSQLIGTIDLPATLASLVGNKAANPSFPDSHDLLPLILGDESFKGRDHLIVQSGTGELALRQKHWKYIPDLAKANGWKGWKKQGGKNSAPSGPGLYDLEKDPGEKNNLQSKHPEIAARMAKLLDVAKSR
jgi:arylsulfatase A-like enzyme